MVSDWRFGEQGTWRYTAIDADEVFYSLQFHVEVFSSVGSEDALLPGIFVLEGNHPNPFRQSTCLGLICLRRRA